MARSGIYKWDVKDARDRLIKAGRHPSIDAVREELGNTGSKSTIHRYLKELEAQDGGIPGAPVSDTLLELVTGLATRLKHEAEEELLAAHDRFDADKAALKGELAQAYAESDGLRRQLESTQVSLASENEKVAAAASALSQEQILTSQMTAKALGLEQQIEQQAGHVRSLEEKHAHAREALEHFRTAMKDQRDQEQRRHEQQVQQLQAEIRTLNGELTEKSSQFALVNRDAAALSSENGALRLQSQESRADKDRAERELARVREAAAKSDGINAALERELAEAKAGLATLQERIGVEGQRLRDLEVSAGRSAEESNAGKRRIVALKAQVLRLTGRLAKSAESEPGTEDRLQGPAKKRLDALRVEAARVLESSAAVEEWLKSPSQALGGGIPLHLVASEAGYEAAAGELVAIEHG